MNVQVTQEFPIRVLMMRHRGSYEGIGPVFDRLWSFIESNHIETQRTIGIYYDNPDFTPEAQLRSAACFEVRGGYQLTSNGGLPITVEEIPGGTYATTRFVGPYEGLGKVWTDFTNYIENTLRRQISDNPAFEVYVNDASETPSSQLITDLYMPLV